MARRGMVGMSIMNGLGWSENVSLSQWLLLLCIWYTTMGGGSRSKQRFPFLGGRGVSARYSRLTGRQPVWKAYDMTCASPSTLFSSFHLIQLYCPIS